MRVRHLDRDGPIQLVVHGQVDQAEPAFAEHALDTIAADEFGNRIVGRGR